MKKINNLTAKVATNILTINLQELKLGVLCIDH